MTMLFFWLPLSDLTTILSPRFFKWLIRTHTLLLASEMTKNWPTTVHFSFRTRVLTWFVVYNNCKTISDFRELNKVLEREHSIPYLGYRTSCWSNAAIHFTKIDLSMMFYCFELDQASKELSTIITSFGKFQYQRLTMGIKVSPDFAQSMIKKILGDLDLPAFVENYRKKHVWFFTTKNSLI